MELELGLKITRTREDVSSSVDFRFSKDPFGPLVLSRETDSRLIIIIHLKGFKKEGIEIEINKEGNRITIRGRKPVEELVLIRWMAWMKEVELRTFKKVFMIPDIVDLDKIKARFDDDDSTLTVTMPKRVKGISGFKLEEEEEEEEENVDYGDVSETQNREEVEEEFGEMMEDKERESRVFEGEEKGFSEGLDEEETQIVDDDLEKIQQIDEEDKILKLAEEETVAQEELSDMNTETEDISLRKLPDIIEQEDNQEVMEKQVETKSEGTESRAVEEETQIEDDDLEKIQEIDEDDKILKLPEEETFAQEELSDINAETEDSSLRKLPKIPEQENNQEVMEKQVETKSEGTESRVGEEIEKPDELDRTSKSKAVEKKTTDGDDDDSLRKAQGIEEPEKQNEESKVQEMVEEETGGQEEVAETETKAEEFESEKEIVGQQEFAGSNTEIEDSILRKLPDILEQENNQEVMEQKVSQVETKSDDIASRANGEQEPDELLDRTSDCGATEKKTTDDNGDSLRKVQGIEEPEGHIEGSKIQDIVEGKGGGEKLKREIKNGDPKEALDAEMGKGFTKGEEFESGKPEADEVDNKHELVGKKKEEEESANARRKSEDISLINLQEDKEQHSKGRKRQENIKDMVEDKTSEINKANDVPTPVQEIEVPEVGTSGETGDQGKQEKEKKKIIDLELRNRDAKEEVAAKMVAETETIPEDLESDKLVADEVDKIHELVEKKKEEEEEKNAKVGTQSEDISLIKPQEIQEQQSQGQKRHHKHEKIKELVEEEQTPEAEKNMGNETPKPVQERCEGKQNIKEEETKKQPEEHKEKMVETRKKINDAGSRKHQEIIKQQGLDESERWEKESKLRGSVESKTNDEEKEEKEIADTETKEQESYQPKILREEEKVQEPAEEEKTIFSKNRKLKEEEKIPEKKTEFGDYDVSRKVGDNQQRDSDAKEEVDAEMGEGFTPNIAETETKAEEFESHKLEPDEVDEIHELVEKKEVEEDNTRVRRQSEESSLVKKLQETEEQQFQGQQRHNKQEKVKELLEEKTLAAETHIANQTPKPVHVTEEPEVNTSETCWEKEIAETESKEKESYRPKTVGEQEKIQELAEEEVAEKKTELGDDDHHISRKVGDIDQRDLDAKEEVEAEMGDGFTPNIAEAEKKAGEVGKLHELADKVSTKSEDTNLKRLQEQKFQGPNQHNKQENIKDLVEEKPEAETNIADDAPKPVQETAKPEVETLETCEDKESAETETKEQESYRPKILGGEDKIQELGEEKMIFSRKVEEEEEIAEKKTESGDDDMSRKVRDIEQQGSDAMKGQEEKDKIEELVLEDKASDGGKRILTETTAENDKSRKVQETDKQQPHEEDKRVNQFKKVIGGEISGHGEVEDVEKKKKTTEADKRLKDSAREAQAIERTDSDASGKYGKGDMIQELQETRTAYQNEQEEEKEDKADGPEKVIDTRKPGEDRTEEESETKTDDVVRKVQGIKEHELFEPKRDHVRKIKEVVEERVAESEIEAECGGLSKAHGSEEQTFHKPNIHKESGKTQKNGKEEPSGQEKEEDKKKKTVESMIITKKQNSTNVQEIKEERPNKPGSYEEDNSKNVREIEKQESDGLKRSTVQDKKKSLVEKDTTGEAKENKNHETKSRDNSSRKTQENEKQESREQKRNYEEQDKKNLGPNYCRNEDDGKEDKEIAEAEGPRELKGIENQENNNELVEEKMNNQEGEDKESMSMEVLAKSEDHESEGHERLRKQDKSREVLKQRLRDNLEDEETEKTETKTNDKESRKIHQINDKETGEEDRREEQASTKGLVEDRTQKQNREDEYEDGSLKNTPEIDKEGLTEQRRDKKQDEIEEPVDREASEDDEEELEVEVEDSEEDWEAEVVQEMDSDKENDNIRHIRRIKLGFRLVGGSTLFMSLIVIVISIIRSKRKIRCYKF